MELRLVKKKRKKKRKISSEYRFFVYLLIVLCGISVFITAKWWRGGYDSNYMMFSDLSGNSSEFSGELSRLLFGNLTDEQLKQLSLGNPLLNWGKNEEDPEEMATPCRKGEFKLPEMTSCHKLLDCADIYGDIDMGMYFEKGKTKKLQRGTWNGHQVAIQHAITQKGLGRVADFYENIRHYRDMHSPFVVQLVGYCNVSKSASKYGKSYLVTEYHERKSLFEYIRTPEHRNSDPVSRLRLAASYLKVLLYLHTLPEGPRIMCDSYQLDETLRQYLVTSQLNVVLSDLDDLPLLDEKYGVAQCKHQDAISERDDVDTDFLAPEQIKTFLKYFPSSKIARKFNISSGEVTDRSLIDKEGRPPPSLTYKVDVYKIPDVTAAILMVNKTFAYKEEITKLWKSLDGAHKRCKEILPLDRPDVSELLYIYNNLIKINE